jgi:hypothetical protein
MAKVLNLTGAQNFVTSIDGRKYVSVDSTGKLNDFEVDDQLADKLLGEFSEFGVPYFTVVASEDAGDDAGEAEGFESVEGTTDEEAPAKVKRTVKIGGKKTQVDV